MVNIYILKLENNKYYIGKTNHPENRLEQHFNSTGSAWTKLYKPIKVVEFIHNCDDYDEDKYTLEYMGKYGINKVRGGSFCEITLNEKHVVTIKRMINSVNDNCYMCGSKDHFIKDCNMNVNANVNVNVNVNANVDTTDTIDTIDTTNANTNAVADAAKVIGNQKCNCISSFLKPHRRKKCLINNIIQLKQPISPIVEQQISSSSSIKQPISPIVEQQISSSSSSSIKQPISPIVEQQISSNVEQPISVIPSNITINIIQSDNNKIPDIKLYYCNYCNKEFNTQKGVQYHENVYCPQKKNTINKETSIKCYKCGRTGHYSNKCYANKHINGKNIC